MNRRAVILGMCAVAAGCPWRVRAQANLRVVGIWWSPLQVRDLLARYKRRLAELGWLEGHNVAFQVRAWDGDMPTMRRQADEMLATHPEVIVAVSNPALSVLKPVSGQLPIIFAMVADRVGSGFIENLARPGGKVTGFTNFEPTMGGKWLEALREASPTTRRVLVLMHPETTAHKEFWRAIEALAVPLRVEATAAGVHNAAEIERAFVEFTETGIAGASLHCHTPSPRLIAISSSNKR